MTDADNLGDRQRLDKVVRLPDFKVIEAQAAEWLVRLDDEEATKRDRDAFRKWLEQSAHHRATFERLRADWGVLDRLEDLNDYAATTGQVQRRPRVSQRGWRWVAALAASLVLAVGVFGPGAVREYLLVSDDDETLHQTMIGERKSVRLADGTLVELNTNTLIQTHYSATARDVRLVQGEAYFDVVPDASRPFSVLAGKGVVTAVGTAFTVRMREEKVDVVVSTGQVALAVFDQVSPGGARQLARLKAGQDAQIAREEVAQVRDLDLEELSHKLSWRSGILAFRGEPLADVVADMSRYTPIKIEIEDESLRTLPVDGYFRIGEIEAMLEALEIMAGLRIERLDTNHILLTKG